MRLLYPIALVLLALLPLLAAALFAGRRRPGLRRILPMALRALGIVALVLVVAGTQIADSQPGVDVVFLVDVSDSIGPEGEREATSFVERALAGADPSDRAAVVLVGEEAAVERGLQADLRELTRESILRTSATSLEDGIIRSLALFEGGRPGRIVVLSDGQETSGDAARAARIANEAGIQLHTVPLPTRPSDGEVFIRRIDVPPQVRLDETHEFNVVVAATDEKDATVTVFRDGEYYGEDTVRLGRGDNVISFQGSLDTTGVHRYGVTVSTPDDPIAVNNEAEALVRVTGEPAVLYVAQNPALQVLAALESQGIRVESRSTDAMPTEVGDLIPYDAVIFDNVPAYDMSVPRMEAVERYVRDTGGGFLMIGGDASFGAGGYYRTPIERTLPVDMDVTSTMRIPSLAMVFVIDKSGSMGAAEASGSTKLDLVKEAVVSAIEIMNPFYTTGLIAFDADFEWTVPITRAGDRQSIIRDLSRLDSGGGTVLEGALAEALRVLTQEEAAVKHLIVLSDGLTNDADFERIVRELREESITVSTVSIGTSSDRELMSRIAEWGDGRSYHTADSKSVPRIFAAETTIVSRNLIVEETFVPRVVTATPIVNGISPSEIPPLEGFVLSYQKNGAQMVLAGTGSNPVLSSWQYGLGRSVAFTSDLRGKWGVNWLGWDGYQQILAQAVRWAQRPVGTSDFSVRFEQGTDTTRLTVDAVEGDGSFRNLLELSARVQPPDDEPYEVDLVQRSPGRYEAEIESTMEGSYIVTVFGDDENRPEPYGLSVPFAREYIEFETDFDRLSTIAQRGGGDVLSQGSADSLFQTELSGTAFRDSLWMWLLVAAIGVLIVELIVKKLILPIGTIVRLEAGPEATGSSPESGGLAARLIGAFRRGRRGALSRSAEERSSGDSSRGTQEATPSYAELRRQVADAYERESHGRRIDREGKHWYDGGEHNPVAERKIYIARKRRQ